MYIFVVNLMRYIVSRENNVRRCWVSRFVNIRRPNFSNDAETILSFNRKYIIFVISIIVVNV